jgi:hypothetical protein
MKFGPASPADAIGGVTVHTLRQGSLVLKKGTMIGPGEIEALDRAGVKEIVVVRLEEGDVSEDVAAASIAQAVAGDGVTVERAFTGSRRKPACWWWIARRSIASTASMKPSRSQRLPPSSRWSKAR